MAQAALTTITLSLLLLVISYLPISLGNPLGAMQVESETTRRLLELRRYISYEALRPEVVPCSTPGVLYYNCRSAAKANAYHRGCGMITRCARSDYP